MDSTAVRSTRLVIGMEIHVELATRTKMFTRTPNVAHPEHFDAPPNSLVDPVVAALPGVLPVMNRAAVEMSMMVGLALNCRIAEFSKWDRKNYFYPDLPKGYQISQYDLPLCSDGHLDIAGRNGETMRVRIIRAHLEEDTGKLGHELPGGRPYDGSLVDLNRAGTPLLEIVSQPDMTSADEAVTFGQELRNICRFLGVTEGIMQRGHMRFEPNVNVVIDTEEGREHATPIVEIKNLNSFKAIRAAIEYEHRRQVEQWRQDGVVRAPGTKRTRGWDDVKEVTVLQREKEEAHDYRYFPDPDLVPVIVSEAWRNELASRVPELPMARRRRYQREYELSDKDALMLTSDRDLCLFYEACVEAVSQLAASDMTPRAAGEQCAKWLLNAGARRANERDCGIHELGIAPDQLAGLVELRHDDRVGSSAADELFQLLCETDDDAPTVAERHDLLQVSDTGQLETWIEEAIAAQPQAAEDFRQGKQAALGRLVGHVMKASKSTADAKAVRERLQQRLSG
ncbi:MAG: Asp-tRNA(Asn)/Glu-tRNA(Gln) amidotransferase subunit GatB [Planctomycetota bacterium]|jgi:aspartyl-tRNA(Asn)/glutamyl-tRNA(Gln) amidotransferase subunit B